MPAVPRLPKVIEAAGLHFTRRWSGCWTHRSRVTADACVIERSVYGTGPFRSEVEYRPRKADGGFVETYRCIWIELPGRHASLAAAAAAAAAVTFEHREAKGLSWVVASHGGGAVAASPGGDLLSVLPSDDPDWEWQWGCLLTEYHALCKTLRKPGPVDIDAMPGGFARTLEEGMAQAAAAPAQYREQISRTLASAARVFGAARSA